ncbi:hypothetical protein RQP46_011087 [Phenoliferia psychrophenolica]
MSGGSRQSSGTSYSPLSPQPTHSSVHSPEQPFQATSPAPSSAITSPTLYVTYGERSVRARIDREVPLAEIIRQLAASTQLGVSEPPALFALRGKEDGELITDENLGRYLDRGQGFVLTSSPTIEAAEIVEKLASGQASILKLATYSLRTLVKERAFLTEFLARGGLASLQEVIRRATGNTLAYALLSMENLITDDRGWDGLESDFVTRVVEIIANEPLINISRPAIAILRKLSHISPSPDAADPSSSATGSGFPIIYNEIAQQPSFMSIVVGRLSSGDIAVATLSLALINSLFRGATELGDERFGEELEMLDTWRIIATLLEDQRASSADLQPILSFQANLVASLHLSLTARVDSTAYPLFDQILAASGLDHTEDEGIQWRRLGFRTESPQFEYDSTGVLGLKALTNFATAQPVEFAALVKDQLARPSERRCPIASASSSITLSLAAHFNITEGVSPAPTLPQPFLFHFYECHALATMFFVRIWVESGATPGDFDRVAALAKSQIEDALKGSKEGENVRAWNEVKQSFQNVEYKTVRERQTREMDIEDDILSKAPVRNLRGRLYRESYEFVRSQRISCLHEGAWFRSPTKAVPTNSSSRKPATATQKAWRFYRLAANRRVLHFVETSERMAIRPGLDDLPERIDLETVTEVVASGPSTGRPRTSTTPATLVRSTSSRVLPPTTNPLAFVIMSNDGVIAELIAPDEATYAEWVDGLSLLRPDGNISTKETAGYVHVLTEIGVKIKLLDLTGEKVDISSGTPVGNVPHSTAFYYSDVI